MAQGVNVGRKRVERFLRQAGLSGLISKRRGRTTVRVAGMSVADVLVKRRSRPEQANVLWFTGITYLRTREGGGCISPPSRARSPDGSLAGR
jgi:hypothetical protein